MSRRPRPSREARNRDAYSRPSLVSWYSSQAGLQAGESALLAAYRSEIEGASVLDIGIGGGRTTGALLPLVGRYLGVDYSLPLVEAARVRFPQVDLRWVDARELTTLGERDLDVAWFSFNGLDYIDHGGRLTALRQVRSVLRPGGLFLFSSHNGDLVGAGRMPWRRPRATRAWLRQLGRAVRHLPQHLRMRRLEERAADHAILNDDAHHYSLLTYYITREDQERQLQDAGLVPIAAYRQDGAPLRAGEVDRESVWLHYAARRPEPAEVPEVPEVPEPTDPTGLNFPA